MAKIDIDKLVAWLCAKAQENDMNAFRGISEFLESQGMQYNLETKEIESANDFKIEAGKWYVCIKDWKGRETYTKGRLYHSDSDRCLTGNNGNSVCIGDWDEYFRPATEEEILTDTKLVDGVTNEPMEISPKFKEGDWIVNGHGFAMQITDVKGHHYKYCFDGNEMECSIEQTEKSCRLWTIRDAKDGDVLSSYNCAFVFNGKLDSIHGSTPCAYCGMDHEGCFIVSDGTRWWCDYINLTPATQEQRETLFKAMKEAGYEWDSDKKELNKIVIPKFKVGDTIRSKYATAIHVTIEEIKNNKYYFTIEGKRKAWNIDKQDCYELVEPNQSQVVCYGLSGTGETLNNSEVAKESDQDELTEFEKAVLDVISDHNTHTDSVEEFAKRNAKRLLFIARKQFQPEFDAEIEQAYKNQDEVVYNSGYDKGYHEAIEDASEWLSKETKKYFFGMAPLPGGKFIEDFRKALEKGD